MIAQRLMCPVYVSSERLAAGRMAETDRRTTRDNRTPSVHLLDDGFQHRRLARAVDIVLLTEEDATDILLPAGNLREPLRALRRAHVVVLRREEEIALQAVLARVFHSAPLPPVWIVERRFAMVEGTLSGRPLAFCGIARPEDFRASLGARGVHPAALVTLRDHQRYDDGVIATLLSRAAATRADGFVTIAKDAVKLTPAMRLALSKAGPLAVCDVSVHLQDEGAYLRQLTGMMEAWGTRPLTDGGH